jgi:hypothetical protein
VDLIGTNLGASLTQSVQAAASEIDKRGATAAGQVGNEIKQYMDEFKNIYFGPGGVTDQMKEGLREAG